MDSILGRVTNVEPPSTSENSGSCSGPAARKLLLSHYVCRRVAHGSNGSSIPLIAQRHPLLREGKMRKSMCLSVVVLVAILQSTGWITLARNNRRPSHRRMEGCIRIKRLARYISIKRCDSNCILSVAWQRYWIASISGNGNVSPPPNNATIAPPALPSMPNALQANPMLNASGANGSMPNGPTFNGLPPNASLPNPSSNLNAAQPGRGNHRQTRMVKTNMAKTSMVKTLMGKLPPLLLILTQHPRPKSCHLQSLSLRCSWR